MKHASKRNLSDGTPTPSDVTWGGGFNEEGDMVW
jgi:hypothetical protein